jgi:hypothetical protein
MATNSYSKMEGYGLYFMLVSPSKFANDLNSYIETAKSIDDVNKYFLNALQQLGFNGNVDVTKYQTLWTDAAGNLATGLDQNPDDVIPAVAGIAFDYTDPPCPPDGDTMLAIFTQLRK